MRKDWISKLKNDSTTINKLAIPGTHDAACWTYEEVSLRDFTWTQRANFTQQLDMGIRAFDLRVGWKHRYGSQAIGMFHGPRYMNQDLDNVLEEIRTWLDSHEEEFVILMFQQQGSIGNGSDCRVAVEALVTKHFSGDRFFNFARNRATWPTVRQLKGRAMVMERLKSRQTGWCDVSGWSGVPTGDLLNVGDNLYVYLQDKYCGVSDQWFTEMEYEARKKMEYVEAAATAVPSGVSQTLVMKVNHTSYSNKRWQPYESGKVVNKMLRQSRFKIDGIMLIDDADSHTVNHILQFNPKS